MRFTASQRIVNHHVKNPDDSIDVIAAKFRVGRSTVYDHLHKFYQDKRLIYVVPSYSKDNTFFAFNGINEREFTINRFGLIDDISHFNSYEKVELKRLGFNY